MKPFLIAASVACSLFASGPHTANMQLLVAQTPIIVPGGSGGFDFMAFDAPMHRVLATHAGNKSLVVLDTLTNTIKQIDTGEISGVAVDTADNKYFVAGDNHAIVVIDRQMLTKIEEVPVGGPGDGITLDPKSDTIFVGHDDGTEAWALNPKTDKLIGSVVIAGPPEQADYDAKTNRIYLNIKPADEIQVIDPVAKKVIMSWPTAPASSPHGLVLDSKNGHLFSAGKNGKLVMMDLKTGKVISSCDIAPGVDQIAWDATSSRIYCACKGAIAVVESTHHGLRLVANVAAPKGAHTLTVDTDSHSVWVSYAGDAESYLQEFALPKSASR